MNAAVVCKILLVIDHLTCAHRIVEIDTEDDAGRLWVTAGAKQNGTTARSGRAIKLMRQASAVRAHEAWTLKIKSGECDAVDNVDGYGCNAYDVQTRKFKKICQCSMFRACEKGSAGNKQKVNACLATPESDECRSTLLGICKRATWVYILGGSAFALMFTSFVSCFLFVVIREAKADLRSQPEFLSEIDDPHNDGQVRASLSSQFSQQRTRLRESLHGYADSSNIESWRSTRDSTSSARNVASQVYLVLSPWESVSSLALLGAILWAGFQLIYLCASVGILGKVMANFATHFLLMRTLCWVIIELAGGAPRRAADICAIISAIGQTTMYSLWDQAGGLCGIYSFHFRAGCILADVIGVSFTALFCCVRPSLAFGHGCTLLLLSWTAFTCSKWEGMLLQKAEKQHLPPNITGLLAPMFCCIFQSGGWRLVTFFWTRFRGAASPLLMSILAAWVINGAEVLRLGCLLNVAREGAETNEVAFRIVWNITWCVIFEVFLRNRIPQALYSAVVLKESYRSTSEQDLLLRSRFGFDHTANLCILWLPILYIADQHKTDKALVVTGLIAVNFCVMIFTDAVVILTQHMLNSFGRQPLYDTYLHILEPGGHIAPTFWIKTVQPAQAVADVAPEADKVVTFMEINPVRIAGALIAIQTMHLSFTSIWQFVGPGKCWGPFDSK